MIEPQIHADERRSEQSDGNLPFLFLSAFICVILRRILAYELCHSRNGSIVTSDVAA